ncbi:MAG: hypothetical protein ACI93N_002575 [Flavobacteriaceae bacterium]|jgi:hypothetical protein
MKKILIIQVIILFTFNGCKKQEDDCLPVTIDFLQGEWEDYGNNLYDLGGRSYFLKIANDTFYLKNIEYSDLILVQCNYTNEWVNYSKGIIKKTNNQLLLKGYYCDSNYNKLQFSYCPSKIDTGSFKMEFDNFYYCNDTLVLQNTTMNEWNGLIKLKKK